MAEHCLALTLGLTRRIPETMRHMRQGQILRSVDYMGISLNGKTLGLVGMGNIARETAKKFIGAFNCKVMVYSPTSSSERWTSQDVKNGSINHTRVKTLQELLAESDVVSLHAPLLPETRNMISTSELNQMKKSAVLLNLARGPLGSLQCSQSCLGPRKPRLIQYLRGEQWTKVLCSGHCKKSAFLVQVLTYTTTR